MTKRNETPNMAEWDAVPFKRNFAVGADADAVAVKFSRRRVRPKEYVRV